MHHARRHDVGPAIGHGERAASEIVVQRAGEGFCVRIDAPPQAAEQRREEVQAVERAVGRVAAESSAWPTSAGRPRRDRERAAFVGQILVEPAQVRPGDRFSVDQCREKGMDRHRLIIRQAGGPCYGCRHAHRPADRDI